MVSDSSENSKISLNVYSGCFLSNHQERTGLWLSK